ncbi:hypothetical protein Bhyg_07263, partial [Pseudolycoriella hygida]
MSIYKMDFGKAVRREIANLESTTNLDVVKTELKKCYEVMTSYLHKKLPFNIKLLKDLQWLHKDNRLKEESVPAIRYLATKIANVLTGTNFTNGLSSDRYTDVIVQQFKFYQTESLDVDPKWDSYSYWSFVGKIKNSEGEDKFSQLTKLAKTYLSLSHGNADPERGFNINKLLLGNREELKPDTITAIRVNQAKKEDIRKKKAESNVKVQKLDTLLAEEALKLKVADRLIDEANESLSSLVERE